jgi:hypothetical protein
MLYHNFFKRGKAYSQNDFSIFYYRLKCELDFQTPIRIALTTHGSNKNKNVKLLKALY